MSKFFPAFHELSGRRVVIAGGGELAARKARLVAGEGVELVFVAPAFEQALEAEWRGRARFIDREAASEDFAGAALAFVAVEDERAAHRLAAAACRASPRAPVNVVDRPELSDFYTPSIVERGDVVVGISTGGAAPVLGKHLRAEIESLLPRRLGALVAFAREFRSAVAAKIAPARRRAFWERFFDGPVAADVLAGKSARAREAMIELVNRPQADETGEGVVHIVGAGPGDPELLTLRALRILQSADVILYDRLVAPEILELARRDADRLYVGKAKADHAVPQDEIEARMIALAREGRTVVRLKGGDPFVFGRGGEELDAVRAAGVAVHVTPGITAATGCAASAGMALTHRDYAQAVTFVTGHAKGEADPDLNWSALAALKNTLVVYMGVGKAGAIERNLLENGRAAPTPVAVIENGTHTNEKVLTGRLDGLARLVADGGVKGPALLVIGEVAALARTDDILAAVEGRNAPAGERMFA